MKQLYEEETSDYSQDEIDKILDLHRQWLESDGGKGERANLAGGKIIGLDLSGAILNKANLVGTKFKDVDLIGAKFVGAMISPSDVDTENEKRAIFYKSKLIECDFSNATMFRANFKESIITNASFNNSHLEQVTFEDSELSDTTFHNAYLKDADFKNSKGLNSDNLAGSDVTNSALPEEIMKFEGIRVTDESSLICRKILFILILGCIYSWITIATTSDAALLTNSVSFVLPIVGIKMSGIGYYLTAPLILLCIHIYLLLNVHNHWNLSSGLPAIFPDGKRLDEKLYPWLGNKTASFHLKLTKPFRDRIFELQALLMLLLFYILCPITLGLFLLKTFKINNLYISLMHSTVFTIDMFISMIFMDISKQVLTLRRRLMGKFNISLRSHYPFLIVMVLFIPLFVIIYNTPNFFYLNANLRNANLKWEDLSGVDLSGANLIEANLHGANLENANLRGADLRGADVTLANLIHANIQNANLIEIKGISINFFSEVNNFMLALYSDTTILKYGLRKNHNKRILEKNLSGYRFHSGNLIGADFNDFNLKNANFVDRDLKDAKFDGANLVGANLSSVKNLTNDQIAKAIIDSTTILPAYLK